ncbi:MAG: cytochrome P460, partial [Reyranella sp.]
MATLLLLNAGMALGILGGRAILAKDAGREKYAVAVPQGLGFADFRGYESWQVISVADRK